MAWAELDLPAVGGRWRLARATKLAMRINLATRCRPQCSPQARKISPYPQATVGSITGFEALPDTACQRLIGQLPAQLLDLQLLGALERFAWRGLQVPPRICTTQRRRTLASSPRSRATCETLPSGCSTSRTASRLNSSVKDLLFCAISPGIIMPSDVSGAIGHNAKEILIALTRPLTGPRQCVFAAAFF